MRNFGQKLLLSLPPELAHDIAIAFLPLMPCQQALAQDEMKLLGLTFKNRVGLAAGLDKNGDALTAWRKLGFGAVEIGTVTPMAQSGNPKPRLFRLKSHKAIINRMGFNNRGIDYLIKNLEEYRLNNSDGPIIGVNIGKNAWTSIECAVDDYVICLKKAYALADYIAVNISSPNTKNLRSLQNKNELALLLERLKETQSQLQTVHNKYTPIIIKIAPDMSDEEIIECTEIFNQFSIDGVIATNTTISRESVKNSVHGNELGGLSGAPLKHQSTKVLRLFREQLPNSIPIIASGGVMSADDACEKLIAGASLVQIYSGFIYQGPELLISIAKRLAQYSRENKLL